MDVPDTDFAVELDEIKPDGTSVQLSSDMLRARYRYSLEKEKLVTPGEINRYEFNGFTFFSRTFFSRRVAKGSRLRMVLTCPNSIQLEKNYNSGKAVAEESAKDARTAHITLYHDAQHASYLEIPVIK
jgi:predicted acyl esterase